MAVLTAKYIVRSFFNVNKSGYDMIRVGDIVRSVHQYLLIAIDFNRFGTAR